MIINNNSDPATGKSIPRRLFLYWDCLRENNLSTVMCHVLWWWWCWWWLCWSDWRGHNSQDAVVILILRVSPNPSPPSTRIIITTIWCAYWLNQHRFAWLNKCSGKICLKNVAYRQSIILAWHTLVGFLILSPFLTYWHGKMLFNTRIKWKVRLYVSLSLCHTTQHCL